MSRLPSPARALAFGLAAGVTAHGQEGLNPCSARHDRTDEAL
jgi:hypothetical protein